LRGGAENDFLNWKAENETSFNDFAGWLNGKPMTFPEDRKTNRYSYD
jgi:hypothetical protein